jgi:hypothetical protein
MNNLNTQIQTQSSSNLHPAQFTCQPFAFGDSIVNLPNADASKQKNNVLVALLKKMNSNKTASDKPTLQTIKSQEYFQPFEHRSQETTLENQLL